jgi:hypothetical protein
MSKNERRVERLEEIANPTPDPEEQRRCEELFRKMEEGRARVMADPSYKPLAGRPDLSGIPPLPNGKVDIAAILQRWTTWHKQQPQQKMEVEAC